MRLHYGGEVGPLLPSLVNRDLVCIILPQACAYSRLRELRRLLEPEQTAFLGAYFEDNQWWPERKIVAYRELVVCPGSDSLACLCPAGLHPDRAARLRQWHDLWGLEVISCQRQSVSFELLSLPSDLPAFVRELYEFCPDPVDCGWAQSLELWQQMIAQHRSVSLHW